MKIRPLNGMGCRRVVAACVLGLGTGGARAADPADVFQFGTASLGVPLTNRFLLRNEGAGPVEVKSAIPSCECIVVTNWTSVILGGNAGIVDVTFVPDKPGEVDYRVYVQTTDPERPEIEYAIRGRVVDGSRPQTVRDMALYLDLQDVKQLMNNPERATWIDVRSPDKHGLVRIPGALQIPLYAVKTKDFLRGRSVVLVDDGHGSSALEEECGKLRAMGFSDVRILYGGLNAWRQLGGILEGNAGRVLDRVPPSALHEIADSADWLMVDAGGGADHAPDGCEAIAFDATKKDAFVDALNAAVGDRPDVACVLIATENGDLYDALKEAAGKINAFVFYLEGGWKAWTAHRQMMAATRNGGAMVARNAGGVRSDTRVRPGGCGGCPGTAGR